MTDDESAEMRELENSIWNGNQVVVGKVQDSKLFKPKDLIGDFGEAFVAEVEFPDVRVWGNHADVLTLQGRSMKGSDVKQRDDDLARHG